MMSTDAANAQTFITLLPQRRSIDEDSTTSLPVVTTQQQSSEESANTLESMMDTTIGPDEEAAAHPANLIYDDDNTDADSVETVTTSWSHRCSIVDRDTTIAIIICLLPVLVLVYEAIIPSKEILTESTVLMGFTAGLVFFTILIEVDASRNDSWSYRNFTYTDELALAMIGSVGTLMGMLAPSILVLESRLAGAGATLHNGLVLFRLLMLLLSIPFGGFIVVKLTLTTRICRGLLRRSRCDAHRLADHCGSCCFVGVSVVAVFCVVLLKEYINGIRPPVADMHTVRFLLLLLVIYTILFYQHREIHGRVF